MKDLAWLGGLLEGEGWFGLKNRRYPAIELLMTSKDTVTKAAALMKSAVCHRRNTWKAQVTGIRAIGWMMTLYPFLGKARQERIISVVKLWKENRNIQMPNGVRSSATCHPDRLLAAHGLCKSCYNRKYYLKKKEKRLLKVV